MYQISASDLAVAAQRLWLIGAHVEVDNRGCIRCKKPLLFVYYTSS